MRKPTFWFPTWSDTNQAVQLQKMARGLKFRILKVVGLYYLCSENKGADQRLCFRICTTLVFSRSGSNRHYANRPMQHTAIFHGCKNVYFQMKNCDIFSVFALKH